MENRQEKPEFSKVGKNKQRAAATATTSRIADNTISVFIADTYLPTFFYIVRTLRQLARQSRRHSAAAHEAAIIHSIRILQFIPHTCLFGRLFPIPSRNYSLMTLAEMTP